MNVAYNMDCMEYMRTLQDKAFDLAVVDPPYGIGEDGGKDRSRYVTQKNGARIYVKDGGYEKTGFDRFVANAAENHGLLYGLLATLLSLSLGWSAGRLFRRR